MISQCPTIKLCGAFINRIIFSTYIYTSKRKGNSQFDSYGHSTTILDTFQYLLQKTMNKVNKKKAFNLAYGFRGLESMIVEWVKMW